MNKNKLMIFAVGSVVSLTAVIGSAILNDNNAINSVFGNEPKKYTIELTPENVSLDGEGRFSYTTEDGNTIHFETSGLTIANGKFNLAQDGFIKNAYEANDDNNKISGIASIECDGLESATLRVDYTWQPSLENASPYYQRRNYVIPTAIPYSFLDERPSYVNVKAKEASEFTSLTLKYDCIKVDEGTDNLIINSASMFERFKTVVNYGNDFEGQVVELVNNIDMSEESNFTAPIGNATYPFKGTFNGNNHAVSNITLTGVTHIAPFGNVVDGTVENVTFNNVNTTSTGQRAAGAVGRAVDATIKNVHVTGTSSVRGPSQNGGVVAVIVKGSDKTQVIDCTNTATVTGTTGGGNGGIVGFVHSGNALVLDCTNNGNVSSDTSGNTAGGIVGAADTSKSTLSIELCEVGKDTTVEVNGVEATSARAANGIIIGSSNASVITVIGSGKVTDLISSVSEYETFVSSCATSSYYQYKVAKLTADLDFENADHGITTFYGLLDGNGHTISNFTKTGSNQVALIGNCFNGGVKNLTLDNVNITATTRRAAAIAGRSEKASYKNILVDSGTITGPTQSGGIVGIVVTTHTRIVDCENKATVTGGTDTGLGGIVGLINSTNAAATIEDCINRGDVTSSKGSIGGIVGSASTFTSSNVLTIKNSKNYGTISSTGTGTGKAGILGYLGTVGAATAIEITDCENAGTVSGTGEYTGGVFGGWSTTPTDASFIVTFNIKNTVNRGSVSGTGNGCGGIVGATNGVQDYLVIKVLDSKNYGAISGAGYVGGISGLIRNTSTTNESIIDNCYNYGNVTSTGTGCGGISGTARINITNSGCYIEATLKAGSTTKLAKNASELGTPGYIALNYETGCPTHTGNRLINLDGSGYTA